MPNCERPDSRLEITECSLVPQKSTGFFVAAHTVGFSQQLLATKIQEIRQVLRTKGRREARTVHQPGAVLPILLEFRQLLAYEGDEGVQGCGERATAPHVDSKIGCHRPRALQRHVHQAPCLQFAFQAQL